MQEEIQFNKRNFWKKFLSHIKHDLYGDQERIYNILRNRGEYVANMSITQWQQNNEKITFRSYTIRFGTSIWRLAEKRRIKKWTVMKDKIKTTLSELLTTEKIRDYMKSEMRYWDMDIQMELQ